MLAVNIASGFEDYSKGEHEDIVASHAPQSAVLALSSYRLVSHGRGMHDGAHVCTAAASCTISFPAVYKR